MSPFAENRRRISTTLAKERNRFVAALAEELFVPYAAPGSKTENLCREIINGGKRLYSFPSEDHNRLVSLGAEAVTIERCLMILRK